jgi:hypothetical protein
VNLILLPIIGGALAMLWLHGRIFGRATSNERGFGSESSLVNGAYNIPEATGHVANFGSSSDCHSGHGGDCN